MPLMAWITFAANQTDPDWISHKALRPSLHIHFYQQVETSQVDKKGKYNGLVNILCHLRFYKKYNQSPPHSFRSVLTIRKIQNWGPIIGQHPQWVRSVTSTWFVYKQTNVMPDCDDNLNSHLWLHNLVIVFWLQCGDIIIGDSHSDKLFSCSNPDEI